MDSLAIRYSAPAVLPANYERAKQALAECERIDECQEWANKAAAIAAYARMSKDDNLVILAQRIQARAIRRCGELLKSIPPSREGNRTAAANAAGLTRLQRNQATQIAQISSKDFERLVEEKAPKIYQLAAIGRVSRGGGTKPEIKCCPTCGRAY